MAIVEPVLHHLQAVATALKAWDDVKLASAFIALIKALTGVQCTGASAEDILWMCRELLDWQYHPQVRGSSEIPGDYRLALACKTDWPPSSRTGRYAKVLLEILLYPVTPDGRPRSQEEVILGVTLYLDREEVKIPWPLKGEIGYTGELYPNTPSRYRPLQPVSLVDTRTYAHALAAQQPHSLRRIEQFTQQERIDLWADLVQLGEGIYEPDVLPDAICLARDTMRRCRENLERIVTRLRQMGYTFRNPDAALVAAPADVLDKIGDFEVTVGPLPLSLCAWFEFVGGVDLTGDHPEWGDRMTGPYPDPLEIVPAEYLLTCLEDNWIRGVYLMDLAADFLTKENISGGTYQVRLPHSGIDILFEGDFPADTFTEYLRICMQWGGFPGWSRQPATQERDSVVRYLTQGLRPI